MLPQGDERPCPAQFQVALGQGLVPVQAPNEGNEKTANNRVTHSTPSKNCFALQVFIGKGTPKTGHIVLEERSNPLPCITSIQSP